MLSCQFTEIMFSNNIWSFQLCNLGVLWQQQCSSQIEQVKRRADGVNFQEMMFSFIECHDKPNQKHIFFPRDAGSDPSSKINSRNECQILQILSLVLIWSVLMRVVSIEPVRQSAFYLSFNLKPISAYFLNHITVKYSGLPTFYWVGKITSILDFISKIEMSVILEK